MDATKKNEKELKHVKEKWPDCSETAQKEIVAVISEYALGHRSLTDQETKEAADMIIRIVKRDLKITS